MPEGSRSRIAAVLLLTVVGVVLSAGFSVAVGGFEPEYEAVEVNASNASEVARHMPNVVNLDSKVAGYPESARRAVNNSTRHPVVVKDPAGGLGSLPDGDIEYAVYNGSYHRANITYLEEREDFGRENFSLRMRLREVETREALGSLAVEYSNAPENVSRIVDGDDVVGVNTTFPVLVERGGSYHLVRIANSGELILGILLAPLTFVAGLGGRAYIVVGIGVAAAMYRRSFVYPLTYRVASAVALSAIPAGVLLAALLTSPDTVGRWAVQGLVTASAAFGLPAGVAIREGNIARFAVAAGASFGLVLAAAAVSAVSSVFLGILVAFGGGVVAVVFGAPLVGYGYWLSDATLREREGQREP